MRRGGEVRVLTFVAVETDAGLTQRWLHTLDRRFRLHRGRSEYDACGGKQQDRTAKQRFSV
jgi:hypothetical protein